MSNFQLTAKRGQLVHIEGVGVKTTPKNRLILGLVGTRESASWTEEDGVTELTIQPIYESGTYTGYASVAVVFDAPSDAVADLWLTEAESKTANNPIFYVRQNEVRTFRFMNPLLRVDIKRLTGTEALRVSLEAG